MIRFLDAVVMQNIRSFYPTPLKWDETNLNWMNKNVNKPNCSEVEQ